MLATASSKKSRTYPELLAQLLGLPGRVGVLLAWQYALRRARAVNSSNTAPLLDQLQPCTISGRRTLVFPAALSQSDFQQLARQVALLPGDWQLLRDRRCTINSVAAERRAWPVAVLLQGLIGLAPLQANAESLAAVQPPDSPVQAGQTINAKGQSRSLALLTPVAAEAASHANISRQGIVLPTHAHIDAQLLAQREAEVSKLLQKKWRAKGQAPVFVADDVEQMARYIARRDQAYELLIALKKQPWNWVYRAGEFRSEIKGNRLSVNSATVYIDTRAGARFADSSNCTGHIDPHSHEHRSEHYSTGHDSTRHDSTRDNSAEHDRTAADCAISPVDALLHELLHVRAALIDTRAFLRSGAMSGGTYPYRHEQEILSQERQLFAAMSVQDARARPQRKRHAGQLVPAACVTCAGS